MSTQTFTLTAGHAPPSVMRRHWRCAIIAWGTETTGTGPGDRIIEIALREVFVSNRKQAREFSTLINPERRVSNTDVHGISDADLHGWPKFAEVWPEIQGFVEECVGPDGGKPILVAHNAEFDKKMLERELQRLGRSTPDWHFACSKTHVSEYVWPRRASYALGELLPMIGVENEAEHTAVGDARTVAHLLQKANQRMLSSWNQARIRKFRHNRQRSHAAHSNRYWKSGDALRRLILMMLLSTPARPSGNGPNAFPVAESESAGYPPPPGYKSPRLIRAVPGGGFFCTRLGSKFHEYQCEGLEDATLIYEIDGPPEDRKHCYYCEIRSGSYIIPDGSGMSAAPQIEQYWKSVREGWN